MFTSPYLSPLLALVSLLAGAAFIMWPARRIVAAVVFWVSAILALITLGLWINDAHGPFSFVHVSVLASCVVIAGLIWVGVYVTSLGSQIADLSEKFADYVEPRRLTDKQAKGLTDYLLHRENHTITICWTTHDEEASQYASQLAGAMREGGWKVMNQTVDDKTPAGKPLGIGLRYREKGNDQHSKRTALLQKAMQSAGIEMSGGGWTNAQGGEEFFELHVGKRPLRLNPRKRD